MNSVNNKNNRAFIVIGLGTGRCGTVSLVSTLNQLKSSFFVHEGFMLPWEGSKERMLSELKNFVNESYSSLIGDVGFYWLPYVEYVLQEFPDTRFICLKREKESTVCSYLQKTEGKNHWMRHDGNRWQFDSKWDRCYPKFEVQSKEEALKLYWETYYDRAAELERRFPDNFKIFDLSVLYDSDSFSPVLEFIGVTKTDICVCHDNSLIWSPEIKSKSIYERLKIRWFKEKKILPWKVENIVGKRGGVKNTLFSAPLRRIWLARKISMDTIDDSLTVVIGIRNRAGMMLYHSLDSIKRQRYERGQISCNVVDYGSNYENAREIKHITKNFGYNYIRCEAEEWSRSKALNIGIRNSNSRYILTSDADIIFSKSYISGAVEVLKRKPFGVVYSYCLDLPEHLNDELEKKFKNNESIIVESFAHKGSKRSFKHASFGINLTYREFYNRINGYDEYYVGWGGEDDDLYRRFLLLGLDPIVLCDKEKYYLHIWHPKYGGVLTEKRYYQMIQNSKYLHQKKSIVRNRKKSFVM
ncbi:MAG: galactosyltransferase-related protein [Nanobdellota archaeon]